MIDEVSIPEPFDAARFLANTTAQPGIYQMFDSARELLYVAKAKNLKKRLASYSRKTGLSPKTAALVARIHQVQVTVTANETAALILEHNLIKTNRPPHNMLLRDDQSFPYIFHYKGEAVPSSELHRW